MSIFLELIWVVFHSDGLSVTVVADDQKTHVLPLALNDLSNAVASTLGLGSIHLTSQPFKTQSPPAGFDGLSFAGSIFLGFTYVIMVMGLAMELIADREVSVKMMHFPSRLLPNFRFEPKTN